MKSIIDKLTPDQKDALAILAEECSSYKEACAHARDKLGIQLSPATLCRFYTTYKIADDAGVTKTQANAALDSFVEAVTKTLKGGGKVTLVGFGTFSVSKRAARNGRNPQTGEVIKIKARKVARFKAGKELSAKL